VTEQETAPAAIDTSVPHPARRYNYWLGGKDNFAADRQSADAIERKFPGMRAGIRANRDVLGRMTRFLAAEVGIRQFLDIGTGLPTEDNTHEVAQRIAPECRVLYVDNDPLVMTHARALLTSTDEGRTDYIEADLRDPEAILAAPQLRSTLDVGRPVALMLVAILHFIEGPGQARALVKRLMDELPSGSYLAATHFTLDFMPPHEQATYRQMLDSGLTDIWPRDRDEFTALFEGLELVEPGIGLVSEWRPDAAAEAGEAVDPSRISIWAGVGRKP
jgi:S-adenosyl methyltransferase